MPWHVGHNKKWCLASWKKVSETDKQSGHWCFINYSLYFFILGEHHFERASINSFLLQKHPNKELIIILAKSDDGTGDYIKRNFGNI